MNLKQVLMELGNKLVTDHRFDPSTPTCEGKNTWPITDFTNWLNGCPEAIAILGEMGFEWPHVAGHEAPHLRASIIDLAKQHLEIGSQCERHKNTAGSMQMRAVANLLYAIAQGHKAETIIPMEDEPSLDEFVGYHCENMVVVDSAIARLAIDKLEKIAFTYGVEDGETNGFEYILTSGMFAISSDVQIQSRDQHREYVDLWNDLSELE